MAITKTNRRGAAAPLTVRVTPDTREQIEQYAAEWNLSISATTRLVMETGLDSPELVERLRQAADRPVPPPLSPPRVFHLDENVHRRLLKLGNDRGWTLAETCRKLLRTAHQQQQQDGLSPPKPRTEPKTREVLMLPDEWLCKVNETSHRTGRTRSAVLRTLVEQALQHSSVSLPDQPSGTTSTTSVTLPRSTVAAVNALADGRPRAAVLRQLVGVGLGLETGTVERLLTRTDQVRTVAVRFPPADLDRVHRLAVDNGMSDSRMISWLLSLPLQRERNIADQDGPAADHRPSGSSARA